MVETGLRRVQRDLKTIQGDGGSSTLCVTPRGDDLSSLDALVIGPPDTPYDGALLHFRLNVSGSYPMNPPEVRFLTTESGKLRLHPQLYADGKVCLSILGTWHGPRWTASSSIRTVLLSIQSLLCEDPLRCEPGMETAPDDKVEMANVFVVHESVRVGILSMLETCPSWGCEESAQVLTSAAWAHLPSRVAPLKRRLECLAARFDGQPLREPFNFGALVPGNPLRRYDFGGLAQRLESLFPSAVPAELKADQEEAARPEEEAEKPGGTESEDFDEHQDEELCCRICHLTAAESGEPLIEPCLCAGTIRYAHSSCLIDWLRHTGTVAQSEWRCDLCLQLFRVRSAPSGAPPGKKLLRRSLLEFVDFQISTECSGWVAVLLTSISQTITCCLCMATANMLYLVGNVLLMPIPDALSVFLVWPMALPGMVVEIGCLILYAMLALMKVSMLCSRSCRPVLWCDIHEQLLIWAAETMTLLCNFRLSGLMALTGYFTADHLSRNLLGINLLVVPCRLLGANWGVLSITSVTLSDGSPTHIIRRAMYSSGTYQAVGLLSSLANLCALILILKAAFANGRTVPVAVLPAEGKKRQ